MSELLREVSRTATSNPDGVTVSGVLDELAARFAPPGSPPRRSVARELVAAVLDVPWSWPGAQGAQVLTHAQLTELREAGARVLGGMPLPYAVRRAAFRTLELFVDERVLIPRPETEQLVDVALAVTEGGSGTAIDVGTGSGAIALSLAAEGSFARILASDVSGGAVDVAESNARRYTALGALGGRGAVVPSFRVGSWLAPWRGERAELVVSNPPYIAMSEADALPPAVRDWEPAIALFAGEDGMCGIRAVAAEAVDVLNPHGWLVLEVDARRAGRAAEAVRALGAYGEVNVKADLAGRARFVVARRLEV